MRRPCQVLIATIVGILAGCAAPRGGAGKGVRMKTTAHCEGDKVWLEGVKGWFVGDKESSPHAAQEAAMQAVLDSRQDGGATEPRCKSILSNMLRLRMLGN
ncbi:MAG: hypothetical protein FJ291_06865 [Planctomycetes bacterium]|nr:hypothetical protein [Planctomycetota bacterium]